MEQATEALSRATASLPRLRPDGSRSRLSSYDWEEKAKRDADDAIADFHKQQLRTKLDATKAPQRHLDAGPLSGQGKWAKVRSWVNSVLNSGILVGLVGGRGTGKTQLAVELIRDAVGENRSARYVKANRLFQQIKASYADKKVTESEIISQFVKVDLLVIDEVSERTADVKISKDAGWEESIFRQIVDERYDTGKRDTVLIGNYKTPEEAAASLGDSIIDRMRETGQLIWCDWKSFRYVKEKISS